MTSTISISDFHPVFLLIFVIVIELIGMSDGLFQTVHPFMRQDKEDLVRQDGKLEVLIKHLKRIEIKIHKRIVMVV